MRHHRVTTSLRGQFSTIKASEKFQIKLHNHTLPVISEADLGILSMIQGGLIAIIRMLTAIRIQSITRATLLR